MRIKLAACFLALFCQAIGQREAIERTLKVEEYGRWESLQQPRISRDGRWAAYRIAVDENYVPGDAFLKEYPGWGIRLVIRTTATALGSQGQEWTVPNALPATFSDDSKWAAYLIALPKKEADKLRDQKQPVENKLGIRNLETGDEKVFDSVQSFAFLPNGAPVSGYLVAHRYRGQAKPSGGSDLLVLDLDTGQTTTIGNVAGYSARPAPPGSKPDSAVALMVDSDSGNRGVQLYYPAASKLKSIHWGKETLSGLTWDKQGARLAFFAGTKDDKREGDRNVIKLSTFDGSDNPVVETLDPDKMTDFPKGKRIVEYQPVSFSTADQKIWFGVQDWQDKKKPAGKPEDLVGIDIWHWKDINIQPRQKTTAEGERRRSQVAVWNPGGKLLVLGDRDTRGMSVLEGAKHAMVWEEKLYESSTTNGINYRDIYVVDLSTGERSLVLRKTQWNAIPSPNGRYLAYFKAKSWWLYDIGLKTHRNMTSGEKVVFFNEDNDLTIPEKPAWGGITWLAKDAGFVLYDKFDAWLASPDRKVTRLTNGRATSKRYRLTPANTDDEGRLSADKPLYFSVLDTIRKDGGYAVVSNINSSTPKVETVMQGAALYGGLQKARDADVFLVGRQTYKDPPNLFSYEDGERGTLRQLSNLNPQQKEYAWAKTTLIQYKNTWGKDLQGTLIYPANFDPRKRYPMIVYIYEKLSDGFYSYIAPAEASAYNMQHFSQSGYFVLMPDIVYRPRKPGLSAQESLEPALDAAIKQAPAIDPKKVGLVGHSWGGYQTAFMLSKSKRFAAGVAGAPLTELISMYLTVYWNSGTPDQEIFETSQGRMEVPFWDDLQAYMANSPVFNARNYTAPIMVAFGDKDGAVDWHQGLYLFNTLRRMGKEIIMLVYEGENHGLARRPNQLDYAKRVRHFFDVKLKGAKPEPWISEGVPFLKRGEG
ncbi:MAG: prolyl oligopeptidase family serine peptidase [Fimbriimonadaceae bacterium]